MTTTQKTGNRQAASGTNGGGKLGDGWDDVPRATSESDHPTRNPQWGERGSYKPEAVAQLLTTVPEGSIVDSVLIGTLAVAQAYGEPRYFVDRGETRFALPNHGVLTSAIDKYPLDAPLTVRLEYQGEGARARPGQRKPFLYDVRARDAAGKPVHPLAAPREDALLPIHKANKAKQKAEKDADDNADD